MVLRPFMTEAAAFSVNGSSDFSCSGVTRREQETMLRYWQWNRGEPNYTHNAALREATADKMERFDVRPPNCNLAASSFSGGNQQKIVVAREIERNPDLLLVGQPTRGVDIGAIEFIHKQIIELRDAGKAVLLVSVELDEILSLSDRIAVMFDGRIMGERLPHQTNEKELGLLMAGITDEVA